MKKPKKTIAAKPPSRRAKASRSKTGAKTLKAAKSPKKRSVKKAPAAVKVEETTATAKAASAPAKRKRPIKTKAAIVSEPAPEIKPAIEQPKPVANRKPIASAKAAPKSPLLELPSVPKAKSVAKLASIPEIKSEAKAVKKPESSTAAKNAPKPEPKAGPETPAEEKPEFGVEFLIEPKSKPRSKPKAKTKRVAKPQTIANPPPPIPAKPEIEAKTIAEIKAAKPISSPPPPESKGPARSPRKAPAKIPKILLEGDKPEPAPVSGPGHRYALGPTAPVEKLPTEGELPESYGTGAILLTARDPHWLYTHWDLTGDQQRRYNAFSRDGHLIVRIYIEAARGKPVAQAHLHPESRHWFVHVDRANTRYVAELGYYSAADKWTVVSTSGATVTPPDAVSADTTTEFATIPYEVPMEKLLSLVKEAVQESAPLARALQELREEGHSELPRIEVPPAADQPESPRSQASPARSETAPRSTGAKPSRPRWKPSAWTPAQERALAEVISMDHVRRVWMGSLEITELIRRQFVNELASMTAAELGAPAPGAPTSPAGPITGISSPITKPGQLEKGFWFNVNAELIVYGATERDATVSIGGRKIKLRPDGSFSYRFALPDGNYEMPVVAISADQTDGRAAEMKFSRSTEYRGDVGAHPQDPSLQQLILENF
jgi:uncharacterized protein